MDNIEDHADRVLSGLKDAVGRADNRLVHLEQELTVLESKTMDGKDLMRGNHIVSSTSDFDEEDISKYLEEYTDNTVDESFSSLCSTTSELSVKNTNTHSTKLFVTHPETNLIHSEIQKQSSGLHQYTNGLGEADNDHSTFQRKSMSNFHTKSYEDDYLESLRHMKMDDMAEPVSPEEIFRQKLRAPGQKMSSTPMSREDENKRRQERLEIKLVDQIQEEGNEFLIPGIDIDQKDRYFKPIHPEALSFRNEDEGKKQEVTNTRENVMSENIRMLLENLETEKKKNQMLSDQVSSLEKDLHELQLKDDLRKHEENTGKLTEIVEDIHHAQKMRENAMMDRLRTAAKDRDEALLRTKALHVKNLHLQKMQKSKAPGSTDKALMEIMDRIATADSGRIIEKYGNELVERINNLRNARMRITSEEMSAVIKERDDAIAKCHSLELELQNCIEELNLLKQTKDTTVNTSLKAKIVEKQEENEQTQKKLHTAEEEMQKLKEYFNLQKTITLAHDKELEDKYNEYLEGIREEAIRRAHQAKLVEAENLQLHDKLLSVTEEKCAVEDKNKQLQAEMHHIVEKCNKLERLVKVLRRKLVTYAHAHVTATSRREDCNEIQEISHPNSVHH